MTRPLRQRLLRSRWLPRAGIGATLLILAWVIGFGAWQLRQKTRGQIVSRDADMLHGVAQMVVLTHAKDGELGGELEQLADQFAVALQLSELNQLNGVIAARLFDKNGQFTAALPANVASAVLSKSELDQLRLLKPVSRFQGKVELESLFLPGTTAFPESQRRAPVLALVIPLHRQQRTEMVGAIEFLIDGQSIAAQFADLDRNLWVQAAMVFVAGGGVMLAALAWAFRRLQKVTRLLMERTNRLIRANQELALSAKTSAVGAITAHLVHGLSSPLSGLEDFVANRAREEEPEPEWHALLASTKQMQGLITEVVRVLGEEQGVERYEVSLGELLELVAAKIRTGADKAGVKLHLGIAAHSTGTGQAPSTGSGLGNGCLNNRDANLVLFILENLTRNAVQATPAGQSVDVQVVPDSEELVFVVTDCGSGVPKERRAGLFKPCRSSKKGGQGIGLAISHELARHMGAKLELERTSEQGSVFALRLPRSLLC